jgi:hypothetical protein
MNSRARCLLGLVLIGVASAIAGCGLTIGPVVERKVLVVKAGQPVRVLENVTVKAERLADGERLGEVDIGGWIAMPPEHFDELIRLLTVPEWPEQPRVLPNPKSEKESKA